MKLLLFGLVFSSSVSATGFYSWDDPSRKFLIANKQFETTILAVDDAQSVCQRESLNRGFSGFQQPVNSCAFWNKSMTKCTIVVPRSVSMHLLGHELLHCILGSWH